MSNNVEFSEFILKNDFLFLCGKFFVLNLTPIHSCKCCSVLGGGHAIKNGGSRKSRKSQKSSGQNNITLDRNRNNTLKKKKMCFNI